MRCYSCRKYDNCELPWKCSSTMYDCSAYELEQTNEEWFNGLSTEEKVKALLNLHEKVRQRMRTEIGGEISFYKGDYYREWLKEKHESEGNDVSVY